MFADLVYPRVPQFQLDKVCPPVCLVSGLMSFHLWAFGRQPAYFSPAEAGLDAWREQGNYFVGKTIGDRASWHVPVFVRAGAESAPSQDMYPADVRTAVFHVFWHCWQVRDPLVCSVEDVD